MSAGGQPLEPGDRLVVAGVELRVELYPGAASPAVPNPMNPR